jgi:hypothetical protein
MSEAKTGQSINYISDTPDHIISLEDGTERHEFTTPGKQFPLESAMKPGEAILILEETENPNAYLLSGGVAFRVGGEGSLKDNDGNYRDSLDALVLDMVEPGKSLAVGEDFPFSVELEHGKKPGKIGRAVTANGNIYSGANPSGEPMEHDPVRYFVKRIAERNKELYGSDLGVQDNRDKKSTALTSLIERYS